MPTLTPQETVEIEIASYLDFPYAPPETDPLVWWKEEEGRFPTLARLAWQYLCVCGTSVRSERIFSRAGYVADHHCACLTLENMDKLVLLPSNTYLASIFALSGIVLLLTNLSQGWTCHKKYAVLGLVAHLVLDYFVFHIECCLLTCICSCQYLPCLALLALIALALALFALANICFALPCLTCSYCSCSCLVCFCLICCCQYLPCFALLALIALALALFALALFALALAIHFWKLLVISDFVY